MTVIISSEAKTRVTAYPWGSSRVAHQREYRPPGRYVNGLAAHAVRISFVAFGLIPRPEAAR